MWTKILNAGESHGHYERIKNSKLVNSEATASKYYMYKDHKSEGGYRPVVGGCSSNTLGLSNLISELLECVATAKENSYSVISSEDMLARISDMNAVLAGLMETNNNTAGLNSVIPSQTCPDRPENSDVVTRIRSEISDSSTDSSIDSYVLSTEQAEAELQEETNVQAEAELQERSTVEKGTDEGGTQTDPSTPQKGSVRTGEQRWD